MPYEQSSRNKTDNINSKQTIEKSIEQLAHKASTAFAAAYEFAEENSETEISEYVGYAIIERPVNAQPEAYEVVIFFADYIEQELFYVNHCNLFTEYDFKEPINPDARYLGLNTKYLPLFKKAFSEQILSLGFENATLTEKEVYIARQEKTVDIFQSLFSLKTKYTQEYKFYSYANVFKISTKLSATHLK